MCCHVQRRCVLSAAQSGSRGRDEGAFFVVVVEDVVALVLLLGVGSSRGARLAAPAKPRRSVRNVDTPRGARFAASGYVSAVFCLGEVFGVSVFGFCMSVMLVLPVVGTGGVLVALAWMDLSFMYGSESSVSAMVLSMSSASVMYAPSLDEDADEGGIERMRGGEGGRGRSSAQVTCVSA